MTTQRQIRVIVAGDHPIFREGLVLILGTQPDIVVIGEFDNGGDALCAVLEFAPDVAILHLRMPGMSGVAVTSAILEKLPGCGILILSTYGGGDDINGRCAQARTATF